jgi:membrane peptidoglycan carboxypeptidase
VLGGFGGLLVFSVLAGLIAAVAVAPVIAITGVTASSTIGIFDALPEYIQMGRLAERNTLYAQSSAPGNVDGYIPIATIYDQNRVAVGLADISLYAREAAIDGEDRRFYEHGGIDVASVVRATIGNMMSSGVESGASTLSMQVVKNIFVQRALEQPTQQQRKDAYNAATATSLDRKLKEMKLAIGLEKKYTKDEILAAYLNISFFGDNTYGIETAAQRYYSTTAAQLTPAQAASLVAIVQYPGERGLDNPDNYKRNQARRDVILASMYEAGHLTRDEYEQALQTPVDDTTLKPSPAGNGCYAANDYAKWFCDYVVKNVSAFEALGTTTNERIENWKRGGYKLYTTLDMDVQPNAQNQTWAWAPNGETAFALGSSTVSVQPGTGRILTMTENKVFNDTLDGGGLGASAVNYNTDYEHGGSSGLQSGSTYKLFTLVAWLEAGHKLREFVDSSARTVEQSKFVDTCPDSYGPWAGPYPFKNDSGGGGGSISVLSATTGSINGAFISMGMKLDLCAIRRAAERLGVERADGTPLWTNPSSILGTNQITPLSLVGAYAAIAAGGVYCKPIMLDRVVGPNGEDLPGQAHECSQAVAPQIAATVAYALQAVVTSGTATGSNPDDGVPLIGKTGTTDDTNQTWVITSTTNVTTGVWVGNSIGMYDLKLYSWNDVQGNLLRHEIMRNTIAVIDGKYGGGGFPPPDPALK